MAKFAALMLWTDAWIADTKHLTRTERGTYLDLLVLMWRTPGCRVPNDDAWLGKHLGMSSLEVAIELRPIILEFCQTDGNHVWQKRLLHEFIWHKKIGRSQSARAKSRWNKQKGLCPSDATVTVTVSTKEKKKKDIEARASISQKETAPQRERVRRSKTTLPENFHPELVGVPEFDKFVDSAKAHARVYADWDAAWSSWQRNAPRFNGGQNGKGRRHGSVLDALDRIGEKLNAQGSFAELYVPGSSGPTPLRLDKDVRPPNLKLIPKG